ASGSYYDIYNDTFDPLPSNIPYFVIYNRYRGILRLFTNVWYDTGTNYDNIDVVLRFTLQSGQVNKLTGLLRHASGFDLPLSEPTAIKAIHSPRFHTPNFTQWMVADFQMAYDPCSCQSQGELEFVFTAFSSLDVDIIGRSISLEVPINDTTYTTRDFMNLSNINTNEYEPGTEIYQNMDRLLEVYQRQQEAYLNQLEEYNDYNTLQRRLFRVGVRTVVKALTKGFSEVVFSDSVATVVLGGDLGEITELIGLPEGLPTAELQSILADWVKERIAASNNTLLMEVYGPAPTKPKPVAVPVATLEESVYKGTINDIDETFSSAMVLPGSVPSAYPNETTLEPHRLPVYNEVLGQVALLDYPVIEVSHHLDTTLVPSYPLNTPWSTWPPNDSCITQFEVLSNLDIRLRITEGPKFALNPALDFDFSKTRTLVAIELELQPREDFLVGGPLDREYSNTFNQSSNFNETSNFRVFLSDWVPLESLNQHVFSLSSQLSFKYKTIGQYIINEYGFEECDLYLTPGFDPILSNYFDVGAINLKVMHDFYFDQIGTSDDQINVLEVFTYPLYNEASGLNNAGFDPSTLPDPFNSDAFNQYIPGILVLGDETISTNHPAVHEVIGSEIFINAEEVLINGPLQVQTGFTAVIQALEQIHQTVDAVFNPKIHMRIKNDFYNTPIFDYTDSSTVSIFCSSVFYQANVDAAAISLGPQSQGQTSEFLSTPQSSERGFIQLFPNPARDLLTLRSSHLDMSSITIHDLSGRPIKQETLQSHSRETQINLSGIAQGTYIVRVDCGDEVFSEKLVVTK
ncbi:MAG: T9SS type A sorting domain-containing protein, partial [Cryomorphaceae bacterium]